MTLFLEDKTHDTCRERHDWVRFVRHDGCAMDIEVCTEHETVEQVGTFFGNFFGWKWERLTVDGKKP